MGVKRKQKVLALNRRLGDVVTGIYIKSDNRPYDCYHVIRKGTYWHLSRSKVKAKEFQLHQAVWTLFPFNENSVRLASKLRRCLRLQKQLNDKVVATRKVINSILKKGK